MKCDKCRCINLEVKEYFNFNLCKNCLKNTKIKQCIVCDKKYPAYNKQLLCSYECLKKYNKLKKIIK